MKFNTSKFDIYLFKIYIDGLDGYIDREKVNEREKSEGKKIERQNGIKGNDII